MAAAYATTVLGDGNIPAEWGDTIPDRAFAFRRDLKEVYIPPRIKKIGKWVFYGCSSLEEIVVPPGVKVGWAAFGKCPKLRATTVLGDADLPTEWGDTVPVEAFRKRHDLKVVVLPPWIKKIGRYAFYYCSNLEECVIPPGVKVGKNAFSMCDKLQATTVLGDADFPAEWGDTVPDYAFKHRLDVVKVELPPRIKKIGKMAFDGCSNLEECIIPPGVKVGWNAFCLCNS